MLREADLFEMAEHMLVEVLGRIRPQEEQIVLPPMYVGAERPMTMAQAVSWHIGVDRQVPAVLGENDLLTGDLTTVAAAAGVSCTAARRVVDGDAVVRSADGELAARDFLLRSTLARTLLAHYVAAYLGSTACPLPEELARPLWELTCPEARSWRDRGYFRPPMPLPPHVSWRDRFLLEAGHEPHPLGH